MLNDLRGGGFHLNLKLMMMFNKLVENFIMILMMKLWIKLVMKIKMKLVMKLWMRLVMKLMMKSW